MRLTIDEIRPAHFLAEWPEQFEIFSHLEFACGIPQLLFAVTTYKPGGVPNVRPHTWSSFASGRDGYYALLSGWSVQSHTYRNILRDGCFCVNFLSPAHYDAMMRCIRQNEDERDEFAACGFGLSPCVKIPAPRIAEAFLALECVLADAPIIAGGALPMVAGRVVSANMDEAYARGYDEKYGRRGFSLNVHSPMDCKTGVCAPVGVATLQVDRKLE